MYGMWEMDAKMENLNPKASWTKVITFDYKDLPYNLASNLWFWLCIKFVYCDWFCLLMLHRWMLYPLHSSITQEEQQRVFAVPPVGFRKVILSTNIAESSITVPDIKYGNEIALLSIFCFWEICSPVVIVLFSFHFPFQAGAMYSLSYFEHFVVFFFF